MSYPRSNSAWSAQSHIATLALFRFPFSAMASRCEVRLYAHDEACASACAQSLIADVRRLDAKYSRYRADSVTAEINRVAAAVGAIVVGTRTRNTIGSGEWSLDQCSSD